MRASMQAGRTAHRHALHHQAIGWRARAILPLKAIAATNQIVQLEEWIIANGGQVNGIKLQGDTAGRRLVATQDLAPGTCLVSVPPACQLRYDTVKDEKLLKLFQRVPTGSDTQRSAWQFKQALTLLAAQAQRPPNPHLSLLPGTAPGVAVPCIGMLLPDQLLDELQYAPLIQDIMNHKYWWSTFYEQDLAPLNSLPGASPFNGSVSKEAFGDAVAVVISRCFGLNKVKAHSMPALIDMADHCVEGANSEVSSDAEGVVSMVCTSHIPAGAQVQLCYGPHTNADLLLSYGFAIPNNPNDRFVWDYDLDVLVEIIHAMLGPEWVQVPVAPWKHTLLHSLGLPSSLADETPAQVFVGGRGGCPVDGRLLGALRVLVAQDDAQQLLQNLTLEQLCDWTQPVARQHEMSVLRAMTSFVTALYQSFPTTIQQDRALLQSDQRPHMSTIITFRLSMKLALEAALKQVLTRYKEMASA